MFIPSAMRKQLYTIGSLKVTQNGLSFSLKNRLRDIFLLGLKELSIDGHDIALENTTVSFVKHENEESGTPLPVSGCEFPLGSAVDVHITDFILPDSEQHQLDISIATEQYGIVSLTVNDTVNSKKQAADGLPRDRNDDFNMKIIKQRQEFVRKTTGSSPKRMFDFDVDLNSLKGNIEHFTGVAQIPVGIAGPLKINGEHATGEYLVPLATTEGTLVASYNRGMKLINAAGGAIVSVVDGAMQRAPVFVFKNAREVRDFCKWIDLNIEHIRVQAEATDPFIKLKNIEQYQSNKFAFLRFNFATGDAAGQNMVGRATYIACNWIIERNAHIENFFLESNMATDKKSSQINILNTRGKRVTAEVTIKKELLLNMMRVDPKQIDIHRRVASVGSFLAGVNNTGLHSANGITAMFIATGQDVANVAESSAAILFSELTDDGDLYLSITLPSLIVATCGGGTGLGTQKEGLEMLDCFGPNKVLKFAEIVASVALAGEISLASAISSLDWVTSHEELGRN
jgi:hydroxymethylglutaryl-CoA reductase (NADPH)